MKPREPLQGLVFYNRDGTLINERMTAMFPDYEEPDGDLMSEYYFKDGKIHGDPGIIYADNRREKWENGVFIESSEDFINKETTKRLMPRIKKFKLYKQGKKI